MTDPMSSLAGSKTFDESNNPIEIVLSQARRSQSWQAWSKEGRKRWVDRFIKEKEEGSSVIQHPVRVNSIMDSSDEEDLITLASEAKDEEELDVIVSSWKRNYTYFQQEQERRLAARAKDREDEEDSIFLAIPEEDETTVHVGGDEDTTVFSGQYENDDDTIALDEATAYTIATQEETAFQEFCRRQEEKQREKSFTERFLEALGMREESEESDDDETIFSTGATVFSVTTATVAIMPTVDEGDEPVTPPLEKSASSLHKVSRAGDGEREAAAAIELPVDAPTIPSFDEEAESKKKVDLKRTSIARLLLKGRNDSKKKSGGSDDDVSMAISHTMTM